MTYFWSRLARRAPLVSVAMCTYNQEPFICEAVDSIRSQTIPDWELVIVDDGSTDGTAALIQSFNDPRITVIHQQNQGPGAAFNRAIRECHGNYVALMSGDDRCYPNRLEEQLRAYLSGNRRVLFSGVDFIDSEGNSGKFDHVAAVFETEPLSRAQILERFFARGNFLNAVTAFTERQVFLREGRFDPTLYQLQDFEIWIRLVKRYELAILPQKTVQYRVHPGNLSGIGDCATYDRGQRARSITEDYLVMRNFFDGVTDKLFYEAFAHCLIRPNCKTDLGRRCEQAFLYARSARRLCQLIGIEKLRDLLKNPQYEALLDRDYDFTPVSFASLLRTVDVTDGKY